MEFCTFYKKKKKINANKLNCFYFFALHKPVSGSNAGADNASNTSANSNESLDASFSNYQATAADTSGLHGSSSQFVSDKLCLIIYELSKIRYACLSWSISSRVPIWRRDASSPSYCRRCSARKTRRLPSRCLSCGRPTWNGFLTWTRTFARIVCSIYATFWYSSRVRLSRSRALILVLVCRRTLRVFFFCLFDDFMPFRFRLFLWNEIISYIFIEEWFSVKTWCYGIWESEK